MADVNTVVIVSNKQDLIEQISQKLVLLRNFDKIKSCSIEEAQSMFDSFNPNVLILHCNNNDVGAIKLIKQIKSIEIYKNLPILLINENCSRETVIEAFDDGISDVLFMPIIDYELLIRVIWCLKKNELSLNIESQQNFLTALKVIEADTGIYSQKYCDEFLKNEITQTKKYSQCACVLLACADKKYPNSKSTKEFVEIVRNAIRLNDSIIAKGNDIFYIYLQKTKLNGAYRVFERINADLGIGAGINAGVVEVQNQKYEDIVEALDAALEKANENTNSLIVASDFYSQSQQPKIIIDNKKAKEIYHYEYKEPKVVVEPKKPVNSEFDENSIKLFNQAYKRKLQVVVEPAFKKQENNLKLKKQNFLINTQVGENSIFGISYNETNASFSLEYDGAQKVLIRLSLTQNGQRRLYETETIDFTILNYRQISMMLDELINKFISLLKK